MLQPNRDGRISTRSATPIAFPQFFASELEQHPQGASAHTLVPDTVELVSEIDIQDLAEMLRFNSVRDRLALDDAGGVDGKQIQTLRELNPESARLLSERWGKRSVTYKEITR